MMRIPSDQRSFADQKVQRFPTLPTFVLAVAFVCSSLFAADVTVAPRRTYVFGSGELSFSSEFPGSRLNDCIQLSDDEFEIVIAPENEPINDSAWFAFKIRAKHPKTISLKLTYKHGTHRYPPKISRDGVHWQPLEPAASFAAVGQASATVRVNVDQRPLWIAAQELITDDVVNAWSSELSKRPFINKTVLGYSLHDRPIEKLEITECDDPEYVYIITRQHPPELSGAIGMMKFVEAVASDSKLAQTFRKYFCTVVVPMMNPDGVEHGHWRHNMAGVDLNRDWGTFQQPETRAMRDELLKRKAAGGAGLALFLDFHSTYEDIFYTASVSENGFISRWLNAIGRRFPHYTVRQDGERGTCCCTSKAWVHETFGIPTVTYEFGDETDRDLIHKLAHGSAEEMMRLLLDRKVGPEVIEIAGE